MVIRFQPPAWLTVDELRKASAAESSSQTFTKIHPHFFEISRILISKVAHDLTEHDQMMPLVRDIWDKRMSKLRTSTAKFLEQVRLYFYIFDSLDTIFLQILFKLLFYVVYVVIDLLFRLNKTTREWVTSPSSNVVMPGLLWVKSLTMSILLFNILIDLLRKILDYLKN